MNRKNVRPGTGRYTGLLDCLADEQEALDNLLFKLRQQNMVLNAGEHRWLASCTNEVEQAIKSLTVTGRRRELISAQLHAEHGLEQTARLIELADQVDDEVVCQQLRQRQRCLRDVLDQVRRCSRQNRQMLASGLAATNDALAILGVVPSYDAAGGMTRTGLHKNRAFDARV